MLEVLGISTWFVLLVCAMVCIPLFLAARFFHSVFDVSWRPPAISPSVVDFGLGALALSLLIVLVQSVTAHDREDREILRVFLSPEGSISVVQNWSVAPSPILEQREVEVRRSYVPAEDGPRPNVVIVVVDALRSDHLGGYGYSRSVSPAIDAWATPAGAATIPFARSVCAESSCGLLAIARSKYPWETTRSDFSLYDVLKLHGYRNYFYLSGDHTNFYGLRDTYSPYDLYIDSTEIKGAYLNDDYALIEAFKDVPIFDGTPTFMQFHLMSVHGLGSRRPEFVRYAPYVNPYRIHLGGRLPSRVEIDRVVNFYDNGMLQLDAVFQQLTEILAAKGYLEDALIVLTGDHGELLGEGGLVTHARSTKEAVLAVPMIIRRIGGDANSQRPPMSGIASQIDIAPTVLREIGATIPQTWSGLPLQESVEQRVLFFAQGAQRGLYHASPVGIFKYTVDTSDGSAKVERALDGIRFEPVSAPLDDAGRLRSDEWQSMLHAEIGPGWSGKNEGDEP